VFKTKLVLTALVMLFLFAANVSARIKWINATWNNIWSDASNWSCGNCFNGYLPSIYDTDYVLIDKPDPYGPVIIEGEDAQAFQIRLGVAAGSAPLTMDGGMLTTAEWMMIGTDANGFGGRFNLNYGAVTIGAVTPANGHLTIGYCSLGILVMNGGTISVAGKLRLGYWVGGNAYVYLNGGNITAADFSMNEYGSGSAALMDFSGGTLIISGDKTALINTYINNGWITANSGSGMVKVDYNQTNPSMTTITANTTISVSPNPANNITNVDPNAELSWAVGSGAVSHNIYFGTDFNSVSIACRLGGDLDGNGRVDLADLGRLCSWWLQDPTGLNPPKGVNDDNNVDSSDFAILASNWMGQADSAYKGNSYSASFSPGTMTSGTIYYWRVDEVNGPSVHKGKVWRFKTAGDSYTLTGKIMCGYQGWFNTPTDGAGRWWVHWGRNDFSPTTATVDMWPDMTEYEQDEKYPAANFDANGIHYYVFSSYNRKTVLRHFRWMRDYGIDGVFMQRFVTEISNSSGYNHFNTVLKNARDGANLYGRKYAVMYDLSGMLGAAGAQQVISDWKSIVDTQDLKITRDIRDNAYMYHKGKPVVAVWGIGFHDGRSYSLTDCLTIVNFFKDNPEYGGCTVMIGVDDDWRTNSDPNMQPIIAKADIISPWTVGRYYFYGQYSQYYPNVDWWVDNFWAPDIAWCRSHNKEYMVAVHPGYSIRNILYQYGYEYYEYYLNASPRVGGQFLWQ
jgi:hypothetical protein